MFAHIDADLLVFRCGFAAERNWWYLGFTRTEEGWDDVIEFQYKRDLVAYLDERFPNIETRQEGIDFEVWSERKVEPVSHALHLVETTVSSILSALQTDAYALYLSGSENYRNQIGTTRVYKGNRDKAHRPTHEAAIKRHMQRHHPCLVSDGEEADDVVAYTHMGLYREDPYSSCIVTQDKDLDMVPGLHYNFVKDQQYEVTEDEAVRAFWYQMATGDSTDNIPGLPKIGAQKASSRLDHVPTEDLPNEVINWYQAAAPKGDEWREYLIEQGRLLWIRQNPGELWEPPELTEEADYGTIETSLYD